MYDVDIRHEVLQVGRFPEAMQRLLDAEFVPVSLEALERNPAVGARIRAIVTRSDHAVPAELIERLPALGLIATLGVGYDRIPVDFAASRGVVVTHTPNVLNAAVAELTLGLMLSVLRRLPQSDRYVREGRWRQGPFPLATGLAGKRVGIVGLGRIGKAIARCVEPFGAAVAYCGRTDQGLPWAYHADVHALAVASDVLVLVAPATAQTERMIDASVLRALGPSGYLINVARGSLVDQAALIEALTNGGIAGAALDVFDNEPDIDSRFLSLDNVVLTPHVGSATHETRQAMARLTLDNLHAFFQGEPLPTPVPTATAASTRSVPGASGTQHPA